MEPKKAKKKLLIQKLTRATGKDICSDKQTELLFVTVMKYFFAFIFVLTEVNILNC